LARLLLPILVLLYNKLWMAGIAAEGSRIQFVSLTVVHSVVRARALKIQTIHLVIFMQVIIFLIRDIGVLGIDVLQVRSDLRLGRRIHAEIVVVSGSTRWCRRNVGAIQESEMNPFVDL
jgi:hypothetical protein